MAIDFSSELHPMPLFAAFEGFLLLHYVKMLFLDVNSSIATDLVLLLRTVNKQLLGRAKSFRRNKVIYSVLTSVNSGMNHENREA